MAMRNTFAALWATVSGANARQRKRQRKREAAQRREEERQRWIEHERYINRMRVDNRRELLRAVSDPDTVPFVRARILDKLLRERD